MNETEDDRTHGEKQATPPVTDRRSFLSKVPSIAMAGGFAASYGTFAAMAGRFMYPARTGAGLWMFVTEASRMRVGDALEYRAPSRAKVAIARVGSENSAADFLALSSTCPHLGCQVHWESNHNRFFCPCHNGTFDPTGKATGGPPGDAGQSLPRYPLKLEGGLLFIFVPNDLPAQDRSIG